VVGAMGTEWYRMAVLILPVAGLVIGALWIRHISNFRGDPITDLADRTRGWLLTRGAIAVGIASVVVAAGAPLVLRRWDRAFEMGLIAEAAWVTAILAAVVGTLWMVHIAFRTPEDGSPPWRYRS
jgi:hypothetical protein